MKKVISIFVYIFLLPFAIFSQVILTDANIPSISDLETEVSIDPTGCSPGDPGPDQKWTFTNFALRDSMKDNWINPQATPYFSTFPLSNVCLLDTCYNYYVKDDTSIELIGLVTSNTVIKYTNPYTILTFPFTYNSAFSDSFAASVSIDSGFINQTGYVAVTGDAYGVLTLPIGTFNNALRIKYIITTIDSSTTYQLSLKTVNTIYEWYIPGKKYYIFKIMNTSSTVPGYGSWNTTTAFYNPGSISTDVAGSFNKLPLEFNLNQNFPNPFNPATIISYQLGERVNVKLIVYDILGKEIKTLVSKIQDPGNYQVEFNAANLPSGEYFYRLEAGNFSESKKLVIIK
jgi:hypothetical protein